MKPIHLVKLSLAIAALVCLPSLMANCYDVTTALCHTATTSTCSMDCAVNCLCPYNANINGVCHNTFSGLNCNTTDSTAHNAGCTGGGTYSSCSTYTSGLENACAWTQNIWSCPSLAPYPLTCVPSMSQTTVYGPRTGVITGSTCPPGSG